MNVVKAVVKAVWPIIINVLKTAAAKTETQIDDYVVAGVDSAIQEWLNDTQEEITFK
jgi:hypothetical protein